MHEEEVLAILMATGANRDGHFLLTSGLDTDRFLLCSLVQQFPEHTARLAQAMAVAYRSAGVEVTVGTAVGGIILAYEVASARSLWRMR